MLHLLTAGAAARPAAANCRCCSVAGFRLLLLLACITALCIHHPQLPSNTAHINAVKWNTSICRTTTCLLPPPRATAPTTHLPLAPCAPPPLPHRQQRGGDADHRGVPPREPGV